MTLLWDLTVSLFQNIYILLCFPTFQTFLWVPLLHVARIHPGWKLVRPDNMEITVADFPIWFFCWTNTIIQSTSGIRWGGSIHRLTQNNRMVYVGKDLSESSTSNIPAMDRNLFHQLRMSKFCSICPWMLTRTGHTWIWQTILVSHNPQHDIFLPDVQSKFTHFFSLNLNCS